MRSQWPVGYKVKEWTLQNKSLSQDNEKKWYVISHKVAVSESLSTSLSEDLLSLGKSSPRAEGGGHSFPLAQRGRQSVRHRTAAQTRPEEWTLGHSNQVPPKHAGTGNSWWRLLRVKALKLKDLEKFRFRDDISWNISQRGASCVLGHALALNCYSLMKFGHYYLVTIILPLLFMHCDLKKWNSRS